MFIKIRNNRYLDATHIEEVGWEATEDGTCEVYARKVSGKYILIETCNSAETAQVLLDDIVSQLNDGQAK